MILNLPIDYLSINSTYTMQTYINVYSKYPHNNIMFGLVQYETRMSMDDLYCFKNTTILSAIAP